MSEQKVDAWDLYWSMFKDGDEVVVVTEDDEFFWGKAYAEANNLRLKRPGSRDKLLDWDEVRFMAHDGFPAKKLITLSRNPAIEALDTRDTQAAIRKVLTHTPCASCGKWKRRSELQKQSSYHRLWYCKSCLDSKAPLKHAIFGDPYLIEDFSALLVNAGISWRDDWRHEETLVLRHRNGAPALLWGVETIYHWEAA